jgi:hypothetical protein
MSNGAFFCGLVLFIFVLMRVSGVFAEKKIVQKQRRISYAGRSSWECV